MRGCPTNPQNRADGLETVNNNPETVIAFRKKEKTIPFTQSKPSASKQISDPGGEFPPKNNGEKSVRSVKNNIFTPLVPLLLRVDFHFKVKIYWCNFKI